MSSLIRCVKEKLEAGVMVREGGINYQRYGMGILEHWYGQ
jgi:hypothetical protein